MPGAGASEAARRAERIARWLTDNGVHLHGVRVAPSPLGGVGVFATEPLNAGAVLFMLPDELVFRPRGDLASSLATAGISGWAALSLAVAAEIAAGDKSRWAGYVGFLPGGAGDPLHLPFLWETGDLAHLRGTGVPLRSGAEDVRAFHARIVSPFVRRLPDVFPSGVSLDQFARCGALVSAYAFSVDRSTAMVPGADALNADGPARASARLERLSGGRLAMVLTRAVAASDEVLNTYGALAESEALLRHGYIGTSSGVESGATAITVREMQKQLGREGGGVPGARLTLAVKRMRRAGVVVRAAPREARPFMDTCDVLPLAHLDEACDELRRMGLAPGKFVGKVLENRLTLLREVGADGGEATTHRAELARRLREIDGPRLQKALDYIATLT